MTNGNHQVLQLAKRCLEEELQGFKSQGANGNNSFMEKSETSVCMNLQSTLDERLTLLFSIIFPKTSCSCKLLHLMSVFT